MKLNRRVLSLAAAAVAALALTVGAVATAEAVTTGQAAPAFSVRDSNGKVRTLEEFAGKTIVLEWTNHDCPFVKAHYEAGNMQALQKEATADGIVWLSVISSAPGMQGYVPPQRANELTASRNAAPTAVLLDPEGAMGRAYDAKTTPHMFVIHQGKVVYQGAIDDNPRPRVNPQANNYVRAALADIEAGRPVATGATQPYGCTVKYKN